MRLSAFDPAAANALLDEMAAEALAAVRLGAPDATITERRSAEMRYAGQGHEIAVGLPSRPFGSDEAARLRAAFEAEYARLFGRAIPGLDIEIMTWSLAATAPPPPAPRTPAVPPRGHGAAGRRRLYEGESATLARYPRLPEKRAWARIACPGPGGDRRSGDHDAGHGRLRGRRRAERGDPARTEGRSMSNSGARAIALAAMWDRLISVVEEQAQALVRTAFGTPTREAGDLSAGVYDTEGNMLAQAVTGTPGHVNSMAKSVGHVLARFSVPEMRPGDVFVTNDPWLGTGHLNDIVVVTPAFRGARPVAFFACTLHVVDIGGRGIPGEARQVFEEGLRIPLMHLARAGAMDEGLLALIRANVREPVEVVGDVYSEVACNEIGCRRLLAMMDEFGLAAIDELARHILAASEAATLALIRRLPFGTWRSSMTVDGIDAPLTMLAALSIGESGIDVDFAGSPGLARQGINVPICYTEAYTSFGVKCIVAPEIPNNTASLKPIRVSAPAGSILNAPDPAPVQARSILGQMLPDLVFGCLRQALPGRVPAEGTSCLWNVRLMGGLGRVDGDPAVLARARPFNVTSFHSGGAGARPRQDGLSATAFPSGVRNVPVEITEQLAPVLVWRKEYRIDSGGPGTFRGGLGQVMEIESAEDMPFAIAATFDRVRFPPRGAAGGAAGACGRVRLRAGGERAGKGHISVPAGERLIVEMPGGGGFGDPLGRDPARVAQDVQDELVSAAAARRAFGVVLATDGTPEREATRRERAARDGQTGDGDA